MIKVLDESNVFNLMRRQFDETTINRFLAGLFRENKQLLRAFLKAGDVPTNVTWYEVDEEQYCPGSGARIDILITTEDKYVCIENKIDSMVHNSGNGESQLKNYVDYIEQIADEDNKTPYFILLYPEKNSKVNQLEDSYGFSKVPYEKFIPMLKALESDDKNVLDFIENMEKNIFVRESDSTVRNDILIEILGDSCPSRNLEYRMFETSNVLGYQIYYKGTSPSNLSFVIVPQRDYMSARDPINNKCNINIADKLAFFVVTGGKFDDRLKRRLLSNGITQCVIDTRNERTEDRSIASGVDHFFRFIDLYGDDLRDEFCNEEDVIKNKNKNSKLMDMANEIRTKSSYVAAKIPEGFYYNSNKKVTAYVDGEGNWTILEGSRVGTSLVASSPGTVKKPGFLEKRAKNIENGKLVKDVPLGNVSPSFAGCYVCLRNINGWEYWCTEEGRTLDAAFPRAEKNAE